MLAQETEREKNWVVCHCRVVRLGLEACVVCFKPVGLYVQPRSRVHACFFNLSHAQTCRGFRPSNSDRWARIDTTELVIQSLNVCFDMFLIHFRDTKAMMRALLLLCLCGVLVCPVLRTPATSINKTLFKPNNSTLFVASAPVAPPHVPAENKSTTAKTPNDSCPFGLRNLDKPKHVP